MFWIAGNMKYTAEEGYKCHLDYSNSWFWKASLWVEADELPSYCPLEMEGQSIQCSGAPEQERFPAKSSGGERNRWSYHRQKQRSLDYMEPDFPFKFPNQNSSLGQGEARMLCHWEGIRRLWLKNGYLGRQSQQQWLLIKCICNINNIWCYIWVS